MRFAIQTSCFAIGGPGGMSPKYLSTFAFTSSAFTSPATTRTAFCGP